MEARGGSTGRDGDALRCLPFDSRELGRLVCSLLSLSPEPSDESRCGDEFLRFDEADRGVAEKDCSNGFGSRSKSDLVWRVAGRVRESGGGEVDCGDWVRGDMT